MDGVNGNVSKALPIAEVKEMIAPWQRQVEGRRRAAAGSKKAPLPPVPPPAAEPERRESSTAVTAAVARPTSVRGAEGMTPPSRIPAAPSRADPPAEADELRPEAVSKQD
jgi:D-aminopeptidase